MFAGVCLWINLYVAPRAQQNLKDAFFQVVTSNPAAAFSSDQVITDFPNEKIYVGNRTGNQLANIHVFELNQDNKPVRVVFARTGSVETDLANKQVRLLLHDTRFEQRDYTASDDLTKISDGIRMGDLPFAISLEELYAKKQGRRRVESFTYEELKADLDKKRSGGSGSGLPGHRTRHPQPIHPGLLPDECGEGRHVPLSKSRSHSAEEPYEAYAAHAHRLLRAETHGSDFFNEIIVLWWLGGLPGLTCLPA